MQRYGWLGLAIGWWCVCGTVLPAADPPTVDVDSVVLTLELVADADADAARKCLQLLADKVQSREVQEETRKALAERLTPLLKSLVARDATDPLHTDAALLATTLKLPVGAAVAQRLVGDQQASVETRRRAVAALVFAGDERLLPLVDGLLSGERQESVELRGAVIAQLGPTEDPRVAPLLLRHYPRLPGELQPKVIELVTQRPAWSLTLLDAIQRRELPATVLHANQVARLLAGKDEGLKRRVREIWGAVRTERNPQREEVIARVRRDLRATPGDAHRGQVVFHRVCGQCHKIHGEGQEVGPDITANGRASLEQLLSNVLDPSLVIGVAYQARVVVTEDGRVLTGLPVEESDQRVVLKIQGGKLETIARDEIDELRVSPLSMMPEGLETQLQPQELLDLFAFLVLDKPPADPQARRIPER